jgi:hypothetical protein
VSAESKLAKHHYIPVFYLKRWTGFDARLCEFSRKYKVVKPRRTSPDGTGYVRGLYRLPNVPDEKADIVERGYMKVVDNGAAIALRALLEGKQGLPGLNDDLKVAWARFLHCLCLRSPEYMEALSRVLQRDIGGTVEEHRDEYYKIRKDADPPTFDEFKARFIANPFNTSAASIIHRLVDSQRVVGHMCGMAWHVIHALLCDKEGVDGRVKPGHDERCVLAKRTRGVRRSNSVLAKRTREPEQFQWLSIRANVAPNVRNTRTHSWPPTASIASP